MSTNNLNILLDLQHQMFFVKVPDGTAYLKFERLEEDVLEYTETYVPESVRKLGIGNELVDHAFQYAISKNLKVKPVCSFVKDFLKKNPAYERVVN